MARNQGWSVFVALLVGVLLASIFWLYGPYLKRQVDRQVAQALKTQPLTVDLARGAAPAPGGIPSQAAGARFQMVTDGKAVFLADLQEGRVWRYFHQSKEGGSAKEDEGFLPIPLYYAGKKFYSATEEAAAKGPEKKPQ